MFELLLSAGEEVIVALSGGDFGYGALTQLVGEPLARLIVGAV